MTQTVNILLTAAGLSRAVPPRNASLMSAYDPMGGGWFFFFFLKKRKLKQVVDTADGVRDIARGTAIDGVLLAGIDDGRRTQRTSN